MVITIKPPQRLGAMPPDPHIWDLLPGTGTPPEKFLPTPLASLANSGKNELLKRGTMFALLLSMSRNRFLWLAQKHNSLYGKTLAKLYVQYCRI